jgi:hypothetical protein
MEIITPENDRTLAFEGTELEGVLPSIEFIKDHLAQFGDQFALSIKHLDNAAKATYKIGMSS